MLRREAALENRPAGTPPTDRLHEFLEVALSTDDPEFAVWLHHFQQTCTPFAMKRRRHRRVMLYTHRIVGAHYWCCDPTRPKVCVGKKKRMV